MRFPQNKRRASDNRAGWDATWLNSRWFSRYVLDDGVYVPYIVDAPYSVNVPFHELTRTASHR